MKVTVEKKAAKSPSEEIISKANEVFYVEDTNGRRIGLRKPTLLDQFDLIEAIGDLAENRTYFSLAGQLLWVVSIDGDAVSKIVSKNVLKSLIKRLENAGFDAIGKGILERFAGDAEKTEEGVKRNIKK